MKFKKPIAFVLLCVMLFSISTDFSAASGKYDIIDDVSNNSTISNDADEQISTEKIDDYPADQSRSISNESEAQKDEIPEDKVKQEYIDVLLNVYFDDFFDSEKKRPDIKQNFIIYADGVKDEKKHEIKLIEKSKDLDRGFDIREYGIKKLPLRNDKGETINYEIQQKPLTGYAFFTDKEKYSQPQEKVKVIKYRNQGEDNSVKEEIKYKAEKIFGNKIEIIDENVRKSDDISDEKDKQYVSPVDSGTAASEYKNDDTRNNDTVIEKINDLNKSFSNLLPNIKTSLFDFSFFDSIRHSATVSVKGYGISSNKNFEYDIMVSEEYVTGESIVIDNGDGTTSSAITNSSIEIRNLPYSGEYTIEHNDGTTSTAQAINGKIVLKVDEKVTLENLPTSSAAINITDTTDQTDLISFQENTQTDNFENGNPDFQFKYNTTNKDGLTFIKHWNDNSSRSRPEPSQVLMSLCYVDQSGNRHLFNSENMGNFCLTTIPAVSLQKESGSNWTYVSDKNLPIYDKSGNKINYSIIEEPVSGYISTYPETGSVDIINTSLTEIDFTKVWNDGENQSKTRVDDSVMLDNMVLYEGKGENRIVSKIKLQSSDPNASAYIHVIEDEPNKKKITVENLPQFDSKGIPIEYSITENEMPIDSENTLRNSADVIYEPSYSNVGESAAEKQGVYNNGTLRNTLSEKIKFEAQKNWLDHDVDKNDRAKGTVYLYRYPNIPGSNYNYESASPIPAIHPMDAPNIDGKISFDSLDRFNEDGYEYVYFVKEVIADKSGFSYKPVSDNQNSDHPDIDDAGNSLVFNNGTLNNLRVGTADIPATKKFLAAANQSMEATVLFAVKRRLITDDSSDESSWKEVKETSIAGFKSEEMTKTINFSGLPEFDAQGIDYEYKIVEKSFTLKDKDNQVYSVEVNGDKEYEVGDGTRYKVTTKQDNGAWTITNQLLGETFVKVEKKWVNGIQEDATLNYHLYDGNTFVESKSATHPNWNVEFTNLPKFDETGAEHRYRVVEDPIAGYHRYISYTDTTNEKGEAGRIANVTNTKSTTPQAYVTVTKTWKDDSDLQTRYPVVVGVYSHDTPSALINTGVLHLDNNWTADISLKLNVDDSTIDHTKYFVREIGMKETKDSATKWNTTPDSVQNSVPSAQGQIGTDKQIYKYNAEKNDDNPSTRAFTVTNTRIGTVDFPVEKRWVDGSDFLDKRPSSVAFVLTSKGNEVKRIVLDGTKDENGETTGDGSKNIWTGLFDDIPKYDENGVIIEYEIREESDTRGTDYSKDLEKQEYIVGPQRTNDVCEYIATNKMTRVISDFKLHKVWMDDDFRSKRPDIYFQLYREFYKKSGDSQELVTQAFYIPRYYTHVDDYQTDFTFEELPQYTDDGYRITYYAIEDAAQMGDYKPHYFNGSPKAVDEKYDFTKEEEKLYNGDTVVNRREATFDIRGNKVWQNIPVDLDKEKYPDANLTLHYFPYEKDEIGESDYNETTTRAVTKDASNEDIDVNTIKNGATSYTYNNLPKYDDLGREYQYVVKEEFIKGYEEYETEAQSYTLINNYVGDKTGWVTGSKEFQALPGDVSLERYPVLTVKLYRQKMNEDKTTFGSIELKASTNITYSALDDRTIKGAYSFNGLEKYGPNGEPYKYWVTEADVNGYSIESSEAIDVDVIHENSSTPESIVNKYTGGGRVTISGTKTWIDENNKYDTRPSTGAVKLELWREDVPNKGAVKHREQVTSASYTWKDNGDGTWTYKFNEDFEQYAYNASTYKYFVIEKSIKGYGGDNDQQVQAINNTDPLNLIADFDNKLDTTQHKITKKWQYDDGSPIDDDAFGLWDKDMEVSFKLLRTTDSGIEPSIVKGSDNNDIIFNIKGSKLRNENDNVGEYTFIDLPAYDKKTGDKYIYSSTETSISIGGSTYQRNGNKIGAYEVSTVFDENKNETYFTNVLESKPLFIQKIWEDEDNRDGLRPNNLSLTISDETNSSNESRNVVINKPTTNDLIINQAPSEDPSWQKYWPLEKYTVPLVEMDNVPKKYSVEEKNLTGSYTADKLIKKESVSGDSTISGSGVLFTFTNTHVPRRINVNVDKKWTNYNWNEYIPQKITLQLNADGSLKDSVDVTSSGDYKGSFSDLYAKKVTGYVNTANPGTSSNIIYSIAEPDIPKGFGTPAYDKTVAGSSGTITVTNKLQTSRHDAVKNWNDTNNRYGSRPTQDGVAKVTVKLQRTTDSSLWTDVINTDGYSTMTAVLNTNGTSNTSNTHSFINLPKTDLNGNVYTYRAREIKIGDAIVSDDYAYGYDVSYTGSTASKTTIMNKLKTLDGLIVRKVWDDNSNRDGHRPDNLRINLYRDGKLVTHEILSEDSQYTAEGCWEYVFKDLPQFQNGSGSESVYDTEEVLEKGTAEKYTSSKAISGAAVNGRVYTFTNTYTPNALDVEAKKIWAGDALWADELRPTEVSFTLKAKYENTNTEIPIEKLTSEEAVKKVRENGEEWTTASWLGLPQKYNPLGTAIENGVSTPVAYYIEEDIPKGYSAKSSTVVADTSKDKDHKIITVTNTMLAVDHTVQKTWNHKNSVVTDRATSAEAVLMRSTGGNSGTFTDVNQVSKLVFKAADGNNAGSNNYKYSNLPKTDRNGAAYTYKVEERNIDGEDINQNSAKGYTVSYNNSSSIKTIIANTRLVVDTMTFEKHWDDQDNKYKTRDNIISVKYNLLYKLKDKNDDPWKIALNGTKDLAIDTLKNTHAAELTDYPATDKNGNEYEYKILETGINTDILDSIIPANSTDGGINGFVGGYNFTTEETKNNGQLVKTKVTNTQITISASGIKEWDDFENHYKERPEDLVLSLYDGDTKIPQAEFKWFEKPIDEGTTKWSFITKKIPRYAFTDSGEGYREIDYQIDENVPKNYDKISPAESNKADGVRSNETGDLNGYKLKNELKKVNLSGSKTWDDSSNYFGIRPDSLDLALNQINGTNVKDLTSEIKIDWTTGSGNNWDYKIENVPKTASNGTDYVYSVSESVPNGYKKTEPLGTSATATQVNDSGDFVDVNFKNKLDTVDVSGTKTWIDQNNHYDTRPTEVSLKVYDGSEEMEPHPTKGQISWNKSFAADKWIYSIKGLPRYKQDGSPFVYGIDEINTDIQYEKTVPATGPTTGEVDSDNGNVVKADITNKLHTVTIQGIRYWKDWDNRYDTRPNDLPLKIADEDGKPISKQPVINQNGVNIYQKDSESKWQYIIPGLPKYDKDGAEIDYTTSIGTHSAYIRTYSENVTDHVIIPISSKGDTYFNPDTIDDLITVTVSGIKSWDDNDDYYKLRPDEISIEVYNGNNIFNPTPTPSQIKWSKDNDNNIWQYDIIDLPKYNVNKVNDTSSEIKYGVKEKPVSSYSSNYLESQNDDKATGTKADENGTYKLGSIKNTLKTLKLSGSKNWADDNNYNSLRPDNLTLNLYQNGKLMTSRPSFVWTSTGSGIDKWTFEMNGLPQKDKNNDSYIYTVSEVNPIGYKMTEPKTSSAGVVDEITGNITGMAFTNELETITIQGTKYWADQDNHYKLRPKNIDLIVYQNEKPLSEIKPSQIKWQKSGSEWQYKISGLPKTDTDGDTYKYGVGEINLSKQYEIITPSATQKYVEGKVLDNGNIVNADIYNEMPTVTIKGEREWNDKDNYYEKRPSKFPLIIGNSSGQALDIQPTGSGVNIYNEKTKSSWSYTIKGLPKYDESGNKISYTTMIGTHGAYERTYDNEVENNILHGKETGDNTDIFQNPKTIDTLITVTITGIKRWEDNNDSYKQRPSALDIKLYNGDDLITDKHPDDDQIRWDKNVPDNNSWKYEISGQPKFDINYDNSVKEISYGVKEVPVTGYSVSYTDGKLLATGQGADEHGIYELSDITNRQGVVSIEGTKTWDDSNNYFKIRPDNLELIVYQDGKEFEIDKNENVTWTNKQTNVWSFKISNLPKSSTSGSIYKYSIGEKEPHGYSKVTPKESSSGGILNMSTGNITGVAFENKMDTVSVSGIKYWHDNDNFYKIRPDKVDLVLYQNGNLMSDINPDQIHFTTGSSSEWSYEITGLPKTDKQGNDFVYGVGEANLSKQYTMLTPSAISQYTTGKVLDNRNVINADIHNKLETVTIKGNRYWNDRDDFYERRPDKNIILDKYPLTIYDDDNNKVQINTSDSTTKLYDKNTTSSWIYVIPGLPKYDKDGEVIGYKTQIGTHAGYKRTYSDNTKSDMLSWTVDEQDERIYLNPDTTDTLEMVTITGIKEWIDDGNHYKQRPEDLEIELYDGDDIITGTNKAPSADQIKWDKETNKDKNQWIYTITGQPKYNITSKGAAVPMKYGIREKPVTGYSVEYPGGSKSNIATGTSIDTNEIYKLETIKNYQDTTSISGIKTWEDLDDRYKLRPDLGDLEISVNDKDIKMNVQPNEKNLKWGIIDENNWKYTITGLPKKLDGKDTAYTVSETIPEYYSKKSDDGFNFKNDLNTGNLKVDTHRIGGNCARFPFKIQYSIRGKIETYVGKYTSINDLNEVSEKMTHTDGTIYSKNGYSFIIPNLPEGADYQIIQLTPENFKIIDSVNTEGKIESSVTKTSISTCEAICETQIINRTQINCIDNGVPKEYAVGGKVAVLFGSESKPSNNDNDKKEKGLTVAWKQDENWMKGGVMNIHIVNFPEDEPDREDNVPPTGKGPDEESFTLNNYLTKRGDLKPITDPVFDELRIRFPDAEIVMEDEIIKLTMTKDENNLPREIEVDVLFVPTLYEIDATPGGKGRVLPTTKNSHIDSGIGSGSSIRYYGTTIEAIADPGYVIDMNNFTLAKPNSGSPENGDVLFSKKIKLDKNNKFTFSADVDVSSGVKQHDDEGVVKVLEKNKSGEATKVEISLNHLHVPLDIGVSYKKAEEAKVAVNKKIKKKNEIKLRNNKAGRNVIGENNKYGIPGKTGDSFSVVIPIATIIITLMVLSLVLIRNRRKYDKKK